jgi:hypothetical protein
VDESGLPGHVRCVCGRLLRRHIDLIYSADQETHDEHIREVLKRLQANGLYAKAEKCEFDTTATEFLGYDIAPTGVSMNPSKVKSVLEWAAPQNIRGLQSFLGFENYYCRFIQNYSKKVQGMTALTKKGVKYHWPESADAAFKKLKKAFTEAPYYRYHVTRRTRRTRLPYATPAGGTFRCCCFDVELVPL